jgi:RecA-family ATPase
MSEPEDVMLDYARKKVEDDKRREGNGHSGVAEPLPYVDITLELTPRQWLVPERIPMRNVSLLSGQGGIGKSVLLMQLSGASALGSMWIGTRLEKGPALYVNCEEEDAEIRARLQAVADDLASTRQTMHECGLRFLSFAGKDTTLGQPDRNDIIRPTPLFERIREDALQLRPRLICIDTVADVFAGKEIDRAQVRQFITMLRGLAIDTNSAVVISAHPSLTGITTDTGLSGSTAWHNSVRARMYFKVAPGNSALHVLEFRKNNYGPVSETILLRWRDGVYGAEPGTLDPKSAEQVLNRLELEAKVDELFLTLLQRFTEQGRNVSDKQSPTYAPTQFVTQPEAKAGKITTNMFAEAMERLFAAHKIKVVTEGPPSRRRTRILLNQGASNAPSNPPSNAFQRPSNGLSTHTPLIPPFRGGVGRAKGALEAPALPAPAEEEREHALATLLQAWCTALGIGSLVTIPFLIEVTEMDADQWPGTGVREIRSALLAVAQGEPGNIDSTRLEQWLRENSGVEIGQLTLHDAGTDKDGLPQWTLRLRVEPDNGSPSL